MKKTIIEEYDNAGKLIKKTTIEEDTDKYNGIYNPNNSITWQSGVREPVAVYNILINPSPARHPVPPRPLLKENKNGNLENQKAPP